MKEIPLQKLLFTENKVEIIEAYWIHYNAKRASAAMINVNMDEHEQEVVTTSTKKVKTSEEIRIVLHIPYD